MKCHFCKEPATHAWRCQAHYRCDDCGATEHLCTYGRDRVLCDPCHARQVEQAIRDFAGDAQLTNEIVCPWCGNVFGDSWDREEGDLECPECERTFEMTRNTTVTYSTYRP